MIGSHYNHSTKAWEGVIMPEEIEPEAEAPVWAAPAVWKTLLRYVFHNARCVDEAVYYFGLACLEASPELGSRMLAAEMRVMVLKARPSVFGFARRAVYRDWHELTGYTPLSALLAGEDGQGDAQERRTVLQAIVRAAWQDLGSRAWESSLCAAFQNFAVLAGEDRDLLAFVTQTEFAVAFRQTRAAVCARRVRKVRSMLERAGFRGTTGPGGKSLTARRHFAEAAQGNHNRAGLDPEAVIGDATEEDSLWSEEHEVPMKPEYAAMLPGERATALRELHEQSERRRLGLE